MYDILTVNCPRCNNVVEFLSQGGRCDFSSYNLEACPEPVLDDVINDNEHCRQCGAVIGLEIGDRATTKIINHIPTV